MNLSIINAPFLSFIFRMARSVYLFCLKTVGLIRVDLGFWGLDLVFGKQNKNLEPVVVFI